MTSGSIVPLLFVGLPSFYGVWLAVFFGLTQHAGLREDVLDHRLNTSDGIHQPGFSFPLPQHELPRGAPHFPDGAHDNLPALHREIKAYLPPPGRRCSRSTARSSTLCDNNGVTRPGNFPFPISPTGRMCRRPNQRASLAAGATGSRALPPDDGAPVGISQAAPGHAMPRTGIDLGPVSLHGRRRSAAH